MPESQEIIALQPFRPLKRSASQVSNLEQQQNRPSPSDSRPPSPTTARLFDWVLAQPVVFDRKGSRSDGFLLALERGNNKIETRRHPGEQAIPRYPVSEEPTSTSTSTDPMETTGVENREYRSITLPLHRISVEPMLDEETEMDPVVKGFINDTIRKPRESMALSREDWNSKVRKKASRLANEAEGVVVMSHTNTPLFPQEDVDYDPNIISKSGGAPWSKQPLPELRKVEKNLSAPVSDAFFAYIFGQTIDEDHRLGVIQDKRLLKWVVPTDSNAMFPFLMLEAKALATKGTTLAGAENEGVGSATHAVSAMYELYKYAHKTPTITDTLAFVITCQPETTHLYVHVWSDQDKKYHMQKIGQYATIYPDNVNQFRTHWRNILDWALDIRLPKIKELLDIIAMDKEWKDGKSEGTSSKGKEGSSGKFRIHKKKNLTDLNKTA